MGRKKAAGRRLPTDEAEQLDSDDAKRHYGGRRLGDRGVDVGDAASGDEGHLQELGVPLDAVVKVWCVHSKPNFSQPWQRRRQVRSNGSGFCISMERRALLTNAHCIEWHTHVKVQRRGTDTKYP